MRVRTLLLATSVVALCLYPGVSQAGGTGTASGEFLRIGAGARSTALAGAVVAVSGDAEAAFGNPAGVAPALNSTIKCGHCSYVAGFADLTVCASTRAGALSLAAGGYILYSESMQAYDMYGEPTEDFSVSASVVRATVAGGDRLRWGIAGSYINEGLAGASESALSMSVGAQWTATPALDVGVAYQDALGKLGEDSVAGVLQAGCAWYSAYATILAQVDVPSAGDIHLRGGAEVPIGSSFALRGGYNGGFDAGMGLSAGAGFSWNCYQLDYAYFPYGDLGEIHRMSISVSLPLPAPGQPRNVPATDRGDDETTDDRLRGL